MTLLFVMTIPRLNSTVTSVMTIPIPRVIPVNGLSILKAGLDVAVEGNVASDMQIATTDR